MMKAFYKGCYVMKLSNARIILFLAALLTGVLLVYLLDGKVASIWTELFSDDEQQQCWH